jgi:hypothetical protein
VVWKCGYLGKVKVKFSLVPCGRIDSQTDMTKLTVAFRNFANAPNKEEDASLFAQDA